MDNGNPRHSRGTPLSLPLKRCLAAVRACTATSAAASRQPGARGCTGTGRWHYPTCSTSLPSPPLLSTSECRLPTCCRGAQTHPAHSSFLPPPQAVAKVELVCTGARTQTELQHAWPPYQRREGSASLPAFCLAAATKNSPPGPVCCSLLFFTCRHSALFHL